MLFLARAENAKQRVRLEQISTRTEFRKLLDFYEIVADEQGVTMEASGNVPMLADPLLLRQALSNLLVNALRYTPRGGVIRLTAEKRTKRSQLLLPIMALESPPSTCHFCSIDSTARTRREARWTAPALGWRLCVLSPSCIAAVPTLAVWRARAPSLYLCFRSSRQPITQFYFCA